MSSTLQAIREKMSRVGGDYREETTTSAGNSGGTTVVCSTLSDMPYDDYYADKDGPYWYCKITSGTYTGIRRKIQKFVQSSGEITVYASFGGQIATSVTFELHRYDPDD